jgi:hypothetical protein
MQQDAEEAASHQLELAEAELAVLKQELALQHLIDTREPTAEARAHLARLREVARVLKETRPLSDDRAEEAA